MAPSEHKISRWDLIIKSIAQNVMAKYGFGHKFYDLKYFEVGFFFIFLVFIIKLRVALQKYVENHQLYVILSCLKK
jgi:hypothetical protein